MMENNNSITSLSSSSSSSSSLRWGILRDAFLHRNRAHQTVESRSSQNGGDVNRISRKTSKGFNLIQSHLIDDNDTQTAEQQSASFSNQDDIDTSKDVYVSYTLPLLTRAPKLVLSQRVENHVNLNDFEICNKFNIDNTGLVCHWPSEDVLAYFCLSHADMFRSKKILELGAGYGLAGLVIAASSDALEVVISDGNPQVVDCILSIRSV